MSRTPTQPGHEIGRVGPGVMGRDFLPNMAGHGFSAADFDNDPTKVVALRQEAGERNVGARTHERIDAKGLFHTQRENPAAS